MQPRLLTVGEVALKLRQSPRSVRRQDRCRRDPRPQDRERAEGSASHRLRRARALARGASPDERNGEPMTPRFEDNPVVYLAYQRARMKAIQARAEKKLGRRGETATRPEGDPPQRRAAGCRPQGEERAVGVDLRRLEPRGRRPRLDHAQEDHAHLQGAPTHAPRFGADDHPSPQRTDGQVPHRHGEVTPSMIPGFEHRWQVEAQLLALEHETQGRLEREAPGGDRRAGGDLQGRARADGPRRRLRGARRAARAWEPLPGSAPPAAGGSSSMKPKQCLGESRS